MAAEPVIVEESAYVADDKVPAPAPVEEAFATEAEVPFESMSVLERLRATREQNREQNRARVAAAIRDVQSR